MERRVRIVLASVWLWMLACAAEPEECLLHSQCAVRARCVQGRCVIASPLPVVDAGVPDTGGDASIGDAGHVDASLSDVLLGDAAHPEAGHVGDAGGEVDGGHLSDASVGDVVDGSPDASADGSDGPAPRRDGGATPD